MKRDVIMGHGHLRETARKAKVPLAKVFGDSKHVDVIEGSVHLVQNEEGCRTIARRKSMR